MKVSASLLLWLSLEVCVTVVLPCVLFVLFTPSDMHWVLASSCAWAAWWAWFFTRLSLKRFTLLWQNDCLVFAAFVRYFRREDPILANAMWKKAHPNIPPPWITGDGKPDAEV